MTISLLLCSLQVGNPLLSTWLRGSTMRPSLPQSVLVSSFSNSSLYERQMPPRWCWGRCSNNRGQLPLHISKWAQ